MQVSVPSEWAVLPLQEVSGDVQFDGAYEAMHLVCRRAPFSAEATFIVIRGSDVTEHDLQMRDGHFQLDLKTMDARSGECGASDGTKKGAP